VLQRGLVGSADSPIPRVNIAVPIPLFMLSIYICAITFMSLHYYNCHASVGLELVCKTLVRRIETLLGTRGKHAVKL
jgi:hypothetical protein